LKSRAPAPLAPAVRAGAALLLLLSLLNAAFAHGVGDKDAAFVTASTGPQIVPFVYLGAKHMVTGFDHLLFLVGVIFFLQRLRAVALYVTVFSIGHSLTLLTGVLTDIHVNAHLVDAVIGLSVAYKGFDNLGGFKTIFGVQPNTAIAVMGFGLFHGFGLATKLQELRMPKAGLIANMVSFNVGVEIGQFIALAIMLTMITLWRKSPNFAQQALLANLLIFTAGIVLVEYQVAGYVFGAN